MQSISQDLNLGDLGEKDLGFYTDQQQVDLVNITFNVYTHVDVDSLRLEKILFIDTFVTDNFEMDQSSSNGDRYSISLELEPGTLFKYRYSVGWQQWEILHPESKNKAPERALIVPDTDTEIEDVVVGFVHINDPGDISYTNVTGKVVDQLSGEPLREGIVWIGGKAVGIEKDGTFYMYNTIQGFQRVTIVSYDHLPSSEKMDIADSYTSVHNETDIGTFQLEATPSLDLVINANVPSTPMNLPVKIVGDHPALGYVFPFFSTEKVKTLTHLGNDWYQLQMKVHAGVPLTFIYTFGSFSANFEIDKDIRPAFRKLVIWEDTVINQQVGRWKTDDHFTMHFKVHVPENTPDWGVNLFTGNGLVEMTETSQHVWETVVYLPPFATSFNYYYQLGTYTGTVMELEHDMFNQRTVTTGETIYEDTVRGWRWMENATGPAIEGKVNISLSISVPYYTPQDSQLYLVGDPFETDGDWENPQGKLLKKLNDHSFGTNLTLNVNEQTTMSVTRGDWSTKAENNFTIQPEYNGRNLYGYVSNWMDLQPSWNRTDLISGVMTIDFWHPDMKQTIQPTFQEFARQGGQWVEIAVILTMTHTSPTLHLSSSTGLNYPDVDLQYVINQAHLAGLQVYLALPLGESAEEIKDGLDLILNDKNWNNYSRQVKDQILYYTEMAQRLGVEMVMLPGYIGPNTTLVDNLMLELIPEMRKIYDGLISSTTGAHQVEFTYLELVDFIGMIMWENVLSENEDPTIDELVSAFISILDTKYLDYHKLHGKPILFSQIAYSNQQKSHFQHNLPEGTPTTIKQYLYHPELQAKIYEAFMRAIANRTWISGLFSFGWSYWESVGPHYSINHELAQSVLLKWSTAMSNPKMVNTDISEFDYTENTVVNLDPRFSEYRLAIGTNANWTEWSSMTELNLMSLPHGKNAENGLTTIWIQGRNSKLTSYPVTLRLAVDRTNPEILTEPTRESYMSEAIHHGIKYALKNSEQILVWRFIDTSPVTIQTSILGPQTFQMSFNSFLVVIPVILLSSGTWTTSIFVNDFLNHQVTSNHTFTLQDNTGISSEQSSTTSNDLTDQSSEIRETTQTNNGSIRFSRITLIGILFGVMVLVHRKRKGI